MGSRPSDAERQTETVRRRALEAERKELGMASGVAIDQGAQPDLMGNTRPCEALGDHADHDAEHGGATVEAFDTFELFAVDLLDSPILEPFVAVGRGIRHGFQNEGASGLFGQVARSTQQKGHHGG